MYNLTLDVRREKALAIPAHTSWKRTARRCRWIIAVELALDAPVVGQVELSPVTIIELRGRVGSLIAKHKAPVEVEVLDNTLAVVLSIVATHKKQCNSE